MNSPPPASGRRPGLLRATTIYGTSNVLQRAIPVLLLPVLTRFLTAQDFGRLAVFTAIVGIVTPLVGFNIPYAVRRRYFDRDDIDFETYVANTLGLLLGGTAVGLLAAWILGGLIQDATALSRSWVAAAILLAAAQVFVMVPLTIWQVEHQPGRYAWVQIGRSAAIATLTLVLVVALGLGWEGAAAATVAANLAFAVLVCAPALKRWVCLRFDRASFQHAFQYGGGLIPHTLGTMAITSADRFVITYYVGASETGLYWIGYQFGFVVSLVADSFNRAWSPWLYEGLKEDAAERNRSIVRRTYTFFAVILAFAALLALVAPPVIHYALGAEFTPAAAYVWWIAMGFAFNGMYRVLAGFVFYSQRTLAISWITGASAAVNLGLNFLLVPRYGAVGAARATLAAFFLGFALTWIAAHRLQPMPWRLRRTDA